jgi:perosamine synthetase
MEQGLRVFYAKPSITNLEVRYATDAAANGWGEHCYDYIVKFEQTFSSHIGVPYAIATSSCTGALHLALSAAGLEAGDEVILADINWIATVAPIAYLGAKPVLVDILPDTWCIDPRRVEEAITSRTRAVIATHIYGNLCEMKELVELCAKYKLLLVEDAAEAIGSSYHGSPAGSIGDVGVFSFHGTKTVTTGEGGMFVTRRPELFETALTLSNHGRNAKTRRQFWPEVVGYKYKISNIQAAIGCAQMERIQELCGRKREIFKAYAQRLQGIRSIRMNPEKVNTINSYWMPTVVFESDFPVDRDSLLQIFAERNIDGRVFFYPLSSLPMFTSLPQNKVSYHVSQRAVNLPSYHDIKESDVERVVEAIKDFSRRSHLP